MLLEHVLVSAAVSKDLKMEEEGTEEEGTEEEEKEEESKDGTEIVFFCFRPRIQGKLD
jgi:hypothetical protein